MSFELRVGEYQGPIEKLLELIEDRKLEITAVSLSQVTDDFLRYLESVAASAKATEKSATDYLRLLADFLVVASRLVLLKSRSLLPDLSLSAAEETDIRDLEHRLKLYRALKPAMKALHARWRKGSRSYERPYFLRMLHAFLRAGGQSLFYPDPALASAALADALEKLASALSAVPEPEALVQENIVTLEAKVQEIIALIGKLDRESFRTLAREKSRAEIVVTFLALLHLAREQLLVLEQEGTSDIIITRPAPAS